MSSEADQDSARSAVKDIDAAGPEAIPVLRQELESSDRRLQYYAVFLLGKVGPPAADLLPELKNLRDDSDSKRFKEAVQKSIELIEKKQHSVGDRQG